MTLPRLAGEVGPLVHVLHGGGGDVEVVALDLAGPLLGPVDRLHREQETVPPAHERLRVDVLVVLGEVEAAAQGLVDDAAVVARRQAELGLGGRAQQRAAVLVQVLPLHHDAVRRSLVGLDVVQRDPHVLQAQRLERLEAEHVADDRRGQVRDRALLEQVDVVGDIGDVLALAAGHRIDPVALGLVVVVGGEPVGPDDRPGRGGGLPGDRGACLLGRDPGLRRDAERGQHVGVLGHVVGCVVAHLRVRDDSRAPAVLPSGHGSSGRLLGPHRPPGRRCRALRRSRCQPITAVSIEGLAATIKVKLDSRAFAGGRCPDVSGCTSPSRSRRALPGRPHARSRGRSGENGCPRRSHRGCA